MFGGKNVGIDLGTCSVLVVVSGKGVVLNEPSIVARRKDTKEILAIGRKARRMVGRTPGDIVTVSPLIEGVIKDVELTELMLRHFLRKSLGSSFAVKPTLLMCVPASVTSVERRAVLQAGFSAGGKRVYLIEEPFAAALGAGMDLRGPQGHMVIDIGGGTTDIAVLSLKGVVTSMSTRIGGNAFDEAIVRHMKRRYALFIGEPTAEEAKIAMGSAHPEAKGFYDYQMRGRDAVTGFPKSVAVKPSDLWLALKEPLDTIIYAIRRTLDCTPPELLGDIIDRGILLTGGGALLKGVGDLIRDDTGLPVHVIEDPVSCVARGTLMALENFKLFERHIQSLTG